MNETTIDALPNWPLHSLSTHDTVDKYIDIYSYSHFIKTVCVQLLRSLQITKLIRKPQSINLSITEYGYDFLFIER